jgi:class 3 adenylate cyclase
MNYAMFGSAVNVAMRLEQLNKDLATLVLASADTVHACSETQRARFDLRALGAMHLRGCAAPVEVYEVRAAAPHANARPV